MSCKVSSIVGLFERFFRKVLYEAVKENTQIVAEWEQFRALLLSTPFQQQSIQAYIDGLEPKELSDSSGEQSGDSYYFPLKVIPSCSMQQKQQQLSSQDDSSSKSSHFFIKQRDCSQENAGQYQEEPIEEKQKKQSFSSKNNDSNREGVLLFDEQFDEDSEYIHFNDDNEDNDDSGSEKSQQQCQIQIAERKTFDGSSLPRHSPDYKSPLILQEITNKYSNNNQRQYSGYQCPSKPSPQLLQPTTSYPSIPLAKKIQGDPKKQAIDKATHKEYLDSKDNLLNHNALTISSKSRNQYQQQLQEQQLFHHGNELNHSVNQQSSSYQQQSQQSSTSSPLSQQCFQTQSHSSSIAEQDQQKQFHASNNGYSCGIGNINFKMNNPTSTKSMKAYQQEIHTQTQTNIRDTASSNQQQERESASVRNNQLQNIQQPNPSSQLQQQHSKQQPCLTSKSLKSILQETRIHTKSIEQQLLQDDDGDDEDINKNFLKHTSSEKKKKKELQEEQQKKNNISCQQYQQQQLTHSSPLDCHKQQQPLLLDHSNLAEQPFQLNQDSDALANLSQNSSFKQRDQHINISKPRNTVGNQSNQVAAVVARVSRVASVSLHQQPQQQSTEQLIDQDKSQQQQPQQLTSFNFPSFSAQIKSALSLFESNSRRIQETIQIHTLKHNNIHNKSQQQLQLNTTVVQQQQQLQLRTQPQQNTISSQHQGSLTPPSHLNGQTYFYNNPNRISYPFNNNTNTPNNNNTSMPSAAIQQLPPSQIEQLNKNVHTILQSTPSSTAACNANAAKSNITTLHTLMNNTTTPSNINNLGYLLPSSKTANNTNNVHSNNNNNSIQQLLLQSTTPGHSNSTTTAHHQHSDSNNSRSNNIQNTQNSNQLFPQQQPSIPIARSQRQLYIQQQQVMRQQQQQQQLQSLQQLAAHPQSQQQSNLPLSSSNSYLKNQQMQHPANIQQTFSQQSQPYFPSKQQQQIVRQSSLPHSNNTPSALTHFTADNQQIFPNDGQLLQQQQYLQRPIQSQQQQQHPQVRAMSALGRDRDREPSIYLNPLSLNNHNNSVNSPIHHLNFNNHNSNPTTSSIYGNSNNQSSSVNSFKRLRTIDCTRNNYHYTNSNNVNNSYNNNSNSINITSNNPNHNHNHSSSQSSINTQMLNLTVDEHIVTNPQQIMNSHNISSQSTAPELQSQQQRKRSEYSFPDIKTFNKNNPIRKM